MTTSLRHTFGLGLLLLAALRREARRHRASHRPARRRWRARAPATCARRARSRSPVLGYDLGLPASATGRRPGAARSSSSTRATRDRHPAQRARRGHRAPLQGQAMVARHAGVAPGGTTTYTFTASDPGHLPLRGRAPRRTPQHQAAMGLHGALVVRPAPTRRRQAYGDAATAYDDEARAGPERARPGAQRAAPGRVRHAQLRPEVLPHQRQGLPGHRPHRDRPRGTPVLLRYVNAGIQHHSMGLLGSAQLMVAKDGSRLATPAHAVAETVAPGQTVDAIATVPGDRAGSKFAVFDGSLNALQRTARVRRHAHLPRRRQRRGSRARRHRPSRHRRDARPGDDDRERSGP